MVYFLRNFQRSEKETGNFLHFSLVFSNARESAQKSTAQLQRSFSPSENYCTSRRVKESFSSPQKKRDWKKNEKDKKKKERKEEKKKERKVKFADSGKQAGEGGNSRQATKHESIRWKGIHP